MILLDTHAFLWLLLDPKRLSRHALSAARRAEARGGLALCSISLWEIAVLVAEGRFQVFGTVEAWITKVLERSSVIVKEITPAVAALATQFPESFPRDPADRLIAATARAEGIPLVTRDERIRESPLLRTIW